MIPPHQQSICQHTSRIQKNSFIAALLLLRGVDIFMK